MTIIEYPAQKEWGCITERPKKSVRELKDIVESVFRDIKENGDTAVLNYERRFDHVDLQSLRVTPQEMEEAESLVPEDLKLAIKQAHQNIQKFHRAQVFKGEKVETQTGVVCWQKAVAIERVGLYAPGGTAPLFSTVLMLATPAKIAGCKQIVLCSPPDRNGRLHPAILYAAQIAGVTDVFKIGGVQAVAAMTYGTASVPYVSKILGPGNQYVMAAKQFAQQRA